MLSRGPIHPEVSPSPPPSPRRGHGAGQTSSSVSSSYHRSPSSIVQARHPHSPREGAQGYRAALPIFSIQPPVARKLLTEVDNFQGQAIQLCSDIHNDVVTGSAEMEMLQKTRTDAIRELVAEKQSKQTLNNELHQLRKSFATACSERADAISQMQNLKDQV